MKPNPKTGSIILIAGFVDIKFAPILKSSPVSSKTSNRFTIKWTPINNTRKSPVMLIRNFCPMDAVKNLLITVHYFCFVFFETTNVDVAIITPKIESIKMLI